MSARDISLTLSTLGEMGWEGPGCASMHVDEDAVLRWFLDGWCGSKSLRGRGLWCDTSGVCFPVLCEGLVGGFCVESMDPDEDSVLRWILDACGRKEGPGCASMHGDEDAVLRWILDACGQKEGPGCASMHGDEDAVLRWILDGGTPFFEDSSGHAVRFPHCRTSLRVVNEFTSVVDPPQPIHVGGVFDDEFSVILFVWSTSPALHFLLNGLAAYAKMDGLSYSHMPVILMKFMYELIDMNEEDETNLNMISIDKFNLYKFVNFPTMDYSKLIFNFQTMRYSKNVDKAINKIQKYSILRINNDARDLEYAIIENKSSQLWNALRNEEETVEFSSYIRFLEHLISARSLAVRFSFPSNSENDYRRCDRRNYSLPGSPSLFDDLDCRSETSTNLSNCSDLCCSILNASSESGSICPPEYLFGENILECLSSICCCFGIEYIEMRRISLGKSLGSGGYGSVYEGLLDGVHKVAVKKIKVSEDHPFRTVAEEICALKVAEHEEHVLRLFGVYFDEDSGTVSIVTELAELGSLRRWLRSEEHEITMEDMVFVCLRIASAMMHIHSTGIMHRDLKSDNILMFANGGVKIADFGLAMKSVGDSVWKATTLSSAGTPGYMAPEVIRYPEFGMYDFKVDVFSAGCVMNEVFTREYPLGDMEPVAKLFCMADEKNQLRPALAENAPMEIQKMITECWDCDPAKRPSFAEMKATLEDCLESLQVKSIL